MLKTIDWEKEPFCSNYIFGLPNEEENSKLLLLPVPWEATVSYRKGTSKVFQNILESSQQVDVFDKDFQNFLSLGVYLKKTDKNIFDLSTKCQKIVKKISKEKNKNPKQLKKWVKRVNKDCLQMNHWVYSESRKMIEKGKIVGLLGGDHSTPLGLLKALSEKHTHFSILHLDAHYDLRWSYQGFRFSHASIMRNALENFSQIKKIVSVGIRDYCYEEFDYAQKNRVKTFFDRDLKQSLFKGENWTTICKRISKELGQNIYLSFDVDSLNPTLCPNTGTPVIGGLDLNEVHHLLEIILNQKKKIIGFDLVETGFNPKNKWDSMVSARILFMLSKFALSQNVC